MDHSSGASTLSPLADHARAALGAPCGTGRSTTGLYYSAPKKPSLTSLDEVDPKSSRPTRSLEFLREQKSWPGSSGGRTRSRVAVDAVFGMFQSPPPSRKN